MMKHRHFFSCAVDVLDVDDFLDSIVGSISKVVVEPALILRCLPSNVLYLPVRKTLLMNVMVLTVVQTSELMVAIVEWKRT